MKPHRHFLAVLCSLPLATLACDDDSDGDDHGDGDHMHDDHSHGDHGGGHDDTPGTPDSFSQAACMQLAAATTPVMAAANEPGAQGQALPAQHGMPYLVTGQGYVSFDIPVAHHDWMLFSKNATPFVSLDVDGVPQDVATAKANGACPADLPFELRFHVHDPAKATAQLSGPGPHWLLFVRKAVAHSPDGGMHDHHGDGGKHDEHDGKGHDDHDSGHHQADAGHHM